MKSRGERKTKLMAMAEKEVDALLEWMEETAAPDLGEIEAIVLRIRKRMGEEMAGEVIDNQTSVRPAPGPVCCTAALSQHPTRSNALV